MERRSENLLHAPLWQFDFYILGISFSGNLIDNMAIWHDKAIAKGDRTSTKSVNGCWAVLSFSLPSSSTHALNAHRNKHKSLFVSFCLVCVCHSGRVCLIVRNRERVYMFKWTTGIKASSLSLSLSLSLFCSLCLSPNKSRPEKKNKNDELLVLGVQTEKVVITVEKTVQTMKSLDLLGSIFFLKQLENDCLYTSL